MVGVRVAGSLCSRKLVAPHPSALMPQQLSEVRFHFLCLTDGDIEALGFGHMVMAGKLPVQSPSRGSVLSTELSLGLHFLVPKLEMTGSDVCHSGLMCQDTPSFSPSPLGRGLQGLKGP